VKLVTKKLGKKSSPPRPRLFSERLRIHPHQNDVVHAIREEMAIRLSDVILRRTDIGAFGCPSDEVLQACARVMASELDWGPPIIEKEIADLRAHYARLGMLEATAA